MRGTCYQAYFGIAAGLCVAVLIREGLSGKKSEKQLLFGGLKYVLMLAASMAGYFLSINLVGVPLSGYMGLDSMGEVSGMPGLIAKAYQEFMRFFIEDSFVVHYDFMGKVNAVFLLCILVLFFYIAFKRRLYERLGLFALLLALAALFPLAINIIYVMTGEQRMRIRMLYSLVLIYAGMLSLLGEAEKGTDEPAETPAKHMFRIGDTIIPAIAWFSTAVIALNSFGYAIKANQVYLEQQLVFQHGYFASAELMTRVHDTEGYSAQATILLVGERRTKNIFAEKLPGLSGFERKGKDYLSFRRYPEFLMYYCGVTQPIRRAANKDLERIGGKELARAVEEMPAYPTPGSVKAIDNYIVVKF